MSFRGSLTHLSRAAVGIDEDGVTRMPFLNQRVSTWSETKRRSKGLSLQGETDIGTRSVAPGFRLVV